MVAVVFNRGSTEAFARHMCVLVPLPSLKERGNSNYSLLRRIRLLILFARVNSLRNFAKQFHSFGACFARRLLANRADFETD
jgi:hypothetical protein